MNNNNATLNMEEVFTNILSKLCKLESEFQANKGIILTEFDLQCLLFRKLYDLFPHDKNTYDSCIKGSPLHTEIKFYDENGKLKYRPDITIIDPQNYSIIHSITDRILIKNGTFYYKDTPSKGFEFCGDAIVIELKFCHAKNGITKIDSFEKDWEKIKRIKELLEKNNSKVYGIVAIFNRTDKIINNCRESLDKLNKSDPNIKVKYYTGAYDPDSRNL
jgi:hypothetical protein